MTTQPTSDPQEPPKRRGRGQSATPAQRVAKAREKLLQDGGKRLPTVYLQPDAANALAALLAAGYGPNVAGVLSAALLDAQRKVARAR